MRLQLALVEMDSIQFGLVLVEDAFLDNPAHCDQTQAFYGERVFRNVPVVLVGDNFLESPRFYGRKDLTDILEGIQIDQIEWTDLDLPD